MDDGIDRWTTYSVLPGGLQCLSHLRCLFWPLVLFPFSRSLHKLLCLQVSLLTLFICYSIHLFYFILFYLFTLYILFILFTQHLLCSFPSPVHCTSCCVFSAITTSQRRTRSSPTSPPYDIFLFVFLFVF